MIYTATSLNRLQSRGVQYLGAEETPDPAKTAATKSDVSSAVGSVASAAGTILSSFFGYKTAELQASKVPSTGSSTGGGMDPKLKTTLLIGGGVAAAALILIVAMK